MSSGGGFASGDGGIQSVHRDQRCMLAKQINRLRRTHKSPPGLIHSQLGDD
jgi:hypothetical protein